MHMESSAVRSRRLTQARCSGKLKRGSMQAHDLVKEIQSLLFGDMFAHS